MIELRDYQEKAVDRMAGSTDGWTFLDMGHD